jgi:hypothetical protein
MATNLLNQPEPYWLFVSAAEITLGKMLKTLLYKLSYLIPSAFCLLAIAIGQPILKEKNYL